jgi:hypothetical protein
MSRTFYSAQDSLPDSGCRSHASPHEKFGIENSGGFDLMSITKKPSICVWHILKYSLRIWNGKMKEHDLEKIAHYAELAWTMSDGKVVDHDVAK